MLRLSDVKTDLVKQEAMIAEWKKSNNWQPSDITPKTGLEKQKEANSNQHFFTGTTEKAQASEKRQADFKALNKDLDKLKRKITRPPSENTANARKAQQEEYREKYNAQKAGNPNPVYYYSIFQGKVKQQKRKTPLPSPSKYSKFTGKYTTQKGDNPARLIMRLLEQHEYIDVDSLVSQLNFNRQAFLVHAKKLEKLGLLTMVKNGLTVAYLERVV